MKNLIVAAFMLLGCAVWAQTHIEEVTFTVKGNCGLCKKRIEEALEIKGVKTASWDTKSKMVTVVFNNKKTTIEKLHKAVAAAGHDTEQEKAPQSVYKNLPDCCLYRDNNPHENE
jgi:copper chaperone CopZ